MTYWIYGVHPVRSALTNPNRLAHDLIILPSFKPKLSQLKLPPSIQPKIADEHKFHSLFGPNAIHQGIALKVSPLSQPNLNDFEHQKKILFLLLDGIQDPHNFGAIIRSAAAFNVTAILYSDKQAPPLTSPVLHKSAAGGVEYVPIISIGNTVQTIKLLKQKEFWCYGLDEAGNETLNTLKPTNKTIFVLGAEGKGLKRLTKEHCDLLFNIPTNDQFPTLNVSNAAAITLFQISSKK